MGHAAIVRLLIDKGANVFQNKDLLLATSLGGNDKIVETLISNDCCLNTVDMNGKTALFVASEEGYTKIVKLLIDNNADIYKVDSDGKTPLHAACCVGNSDIVSILISKDSDLNMFDLDLETPLHKACRKGSIVIIQKLLASGADIDKTNRHVRTPVYIAKTDGGVIDEHILKALEGKEVDQTEDKQNLSTKNKNKLTSNLIQSGWTPLYEACINGDIDIIQSLIRNRADVNMKTDSGEMPLVAACQQGNGFLIQMLIDEGADVNKALCCAAEKDYDRTIKILSYKGGNICYKGVDGKSLMSLACEKGSVKVVKYLFKKGADFTEKDVNGKTLIHVACNTGSVDFVEILIDMGLDLSIHDNNGRYPLSVSLDRGFNDLSKHLIEKSCPIAISEEDRKKVLISVFESKNREISKLLVLNGYTENLSNFHETVLYYACILCIREEIAFFRGKDFEKTYKHEYIPMILADIAGNDDLSEYLQNSTSSIHFSLYVDTTLRRRLERAHLFSIDNRLSLREYQNLCQACMHGEDKSSMFEKMTPGNIFNIFIKQGELGVSIWFDQTPLCLAVRRGHTKVVKFLIKHGVDVNLTFEEKGTNGNASLSSIIQYGYTPLFAACQRKYYEIVDMLLEGGANLNKALYDACREGYLDTVQFLLKKGAHVNSIGRFGQTALFAACIGGYDSIVKYLISQGSVLDTKVRRASFFDEPVCLHAAYLCDNHNIVEFLINRGASVDTVGNFGRTLLHTSCRDGNHEIVKILIDKGANINASDIYGATPLIAGVSQNIEHTHAEQTFIQRYRDDHLLNVYGINRPLGDFHDQLHKQYVNEWTTYYPSYLESKYNFLTDDHYKVIKLLIENGADINKTDKTHRTPLSLAEKIGDVKLSNILLHKVLLPIKKDNSQGRNQDS